MTAPGISAADRAAALRLMAVSRETEGRLDAFAEILQRWQSRINLISPNTLPHLWTRHIADSWQLAGLAPEAKTWVDFGSGGGFPGVVLAILLMERPGARITLVESNHKKAAFLREAIRVVGAQATVLCCRIEDAGGQLPERPDIVTARAVAPLENLCALAFPLLKTGGRALFPKGQDVESELTDAAKSWMFSVVRHRSKVDAASTIVEISALSPVSRAAPASAAAPTSEGI